MTRKLFLFTFFLAFILNACRCTKEIDCGDPPIYPTFIGFQAADIDTFIVRKYQSGTNYQSLIDTVLVKYNDFYHISNDTTKVAFYLKGDQGIRMGFDWQIYIPAVQRTIAVTNIIGNKKSTQCGGLADASKCGCLNDLFSAKRDNETVTFTNTDKNSPVIYIKK